MNTDAQKLLIKKIMLLQDYMTDLDLYINLSDTEILNNKDKNYAMERCFQLVVDEAVDINALVVYQLGNTIPDDSKSSFYALADIKIIEHEFAQNISDSAKIRNQVTHDYDKLSKVQVVQSIKKFYEMYKTYTKILIDTFVPH